jgi:hypothetical protein
MKWLALFGLSGTHSDSFILNLFDALYCCISPKFCNLGITINQVLFLAGLSLTTAINAVIVDLCIPVWTTAVCVMLKREKKSWLKFAGNVCRFHSNSSKFFSLLFIQELPLLWWEERLCYK